MDQNDQERLDAYERMRQAIIADQERVIQEMEKLKRRYKKTTVTYKQLRIQKLANKNILDMYHIYGID